MHGSIGTQLGELLAQYEEDLSLGGDSVENIQKVALISEAYRNFAAGEMPGFSDDFHAGYTEMVAFLLKDNSTFDARTVFETNSADPPPPSNG